MPSAVSSGRTEAQTRRGLTAEGSAYAKKEKDFVEKISVKVLREA
jgi:hypothetical protein